MLSHLDPLETAGDPDALGDALVTAMAELGRPPFRARGISRVTAKDGAYRSLEWEAASIRDVADRKTVQTILRLA